MGCAASTNANRPNGRIPRSAAEIMFRKYDTSGDGSLSKSEFKKLCQSLGYKLTDQELEYDMKMLDLSGDGQINFAEFTKWWSNDKRFVELQWNEDRIQLIQQLNDDFKLFDKDGSGKLDKKEFKQIHEKMIKNHYSNVDAATAFAMIDTSGDGKVDFAEYARFMLKKKN